MSYVWYVGPADSRVFLAGDVGWSGPTTIWAKANAWSLPQELFTADQLTTLYNSGEFTFDNPAPKNVDHSPFTDSMLNKFQQLLTQVQNAAAGVMDTPVTAPPSGQYFKIPPIGSGGTLALTNAREYCMPFYVPADAPVASIGQEIMAVGTAGALVRIGIRSALTSGRPGPPVVDLGTVDGTVVAKPEIAWVSTLRRGWYYASITGQGTPTTPATVRAASAFPVPSGLITFTSAVSAGAYCGYYMSGVTGALPAVFTPTNVASTLPALFAKYQ